MTSQGYPQSMAGENEFIAEKVLRYEQFLNETLKSDLQYVSQYMNNDAN